MIRQNWKLKFQSVTGLFIGLILSCIIHSPGAHGDFLGPEFNCANNHGYGLSSGKYAHNGYGSRISSIWVKGFRAADQVISLGVNLQFLTCDFDGTETVPKLRRPFAAEFSEIARFEFFDELQTTFDGPSFTGRYFPLSRGEHFFSTHIELPFSEVLRPCEIIDLNTRLPSPQSHKSRPVWLKLTFYNHLEKPSYGRSSWKTKDETAPNGAVEFVVTIWKENGELHHQLFPQPIQFMRERFPSHCTNQVSN